MLAHPCDPKLHEDYVASAEDYVSLAEQANGPIPRHAKPAYVWGVALDELERMRPDARIINLETAITRSDDYARKGINYRMSPENADCLSAAGIDCCELANNHVLDWGPSGLVETLATLERLKIRAAGAGRNAFEAAAPATLDLANDARLLVFSFGAVTSGIPRSWAATTDIPGVNLLTRLSEADARHAAEYIVNIKKPGDLVVVSLHWGSNWGYEVPADQKLFARTLIDRRMYPSFMAIHRITPKPSRSTINGSFSMVAAISSMIMKASADTKNIAATCRLCISWISNRRLEISLRSKSSLFKSGTSSLSTRRDRTSDGCNGRFSENVGSSGPASYSIQAAGSPFPTMSTPLRHSVGEDQH